jgi:hypothetical protein
MRLLRGLLGGLLWIVAGVVGLLGVVLCVTVILLPLGLPLLGLARRLFGRSMQLVLPRTVTHPADELKKSARKKKDDVASAAPDTKRLGKKGSKATKKGKKMVKKQRKRLA